MNPQQIRDEIEKTYIVTPDGRCVNRERGTEVVFPLDKKGYKKTRLWAPALSKNKDRRIPFRMHRLVAMFYIKDFNPKLQVNHKNGIKTDNRIENLEMTTNAGNAWHGWNVLNSTRRREMMSKRFTGTHHTEESKEKMSRSHMGLGKGRRHSPETKLKQSLARTAYLERKRRVLS